MEESVRRPQEAHRRAAAGPGIIRGIKYPAPHVGGEPGDVGGNGGGGRQSSGREGGSGSVGGGEGSGDGADSKEQVIRTGMMR